MTVNPLLAQFADEPAFVSEAHAASVEACLNGAYADPRFGELAVFSSEDDDDFWDENIAWARPYVVADGVLQIPVRGLLVNNFPYQFGGWLTGYEYIRRAAMRGMADANVNGIAFLIDSPGGYVAGNQDLVDDLYAMRGQKPIRCYASDSAYSAAYNIASVADPGELYVSKTGGVGSIGVVTMHVDYSEKLKKEGIKVTYIYAGKHKVEGNSTEPLPDDVRDRMKARIDALYEVFVSSVARNRGLDAQAVRDTEAGVFYGNEALSIGLADKVGRIDAALSAFADQLKGERMMSEKKDNDMAAADHAAALTAARAEATAAAVVAERARIKAIVEHAEAEGRADLANHLAFDTDMTAEAAGALLAKSPKAAPAAPAATQTPFQANAGKDEPNLGDGGGGSDKKSDRASSVIALMRSVNPNFVKKD